MVTVTPFGTMPDGRPFSLYEISDGTAGGITVRVTDLGATITGIDAPDRSGTLTDVVLGFDEGNRYLDNAAAYFGATVGPSANRTLDSRVPVGGSVYQLPQNEGPNNLHTDPAQGLHAQLWSALVDNDGVTFACAAADGACGLPGNRLFMVRYEVREATLRVTYRAVSDAETFINLTNHAYFNLAGEGSGSVLGHELELKARAFTPQDAAHIPTGEIRPVAGTPFDFTVPKALGKDIDADDEQISFGSGYDHNFCIDGFNAEATEPRVAAVLHDPVSGRTLTLATTLPGLQIYTGNFVGEEHGKNGHAYHGRESVALEPQYYPSNLARPGFEKAVFGPLKPYCAISEYRFSAR